MKILLAYPYPLESRISDEDISVVPIGLYHVAAVLKHHDYDVEILNWWDIQKTPEIISKTLAEKNPDIIGFSILHANRWGAIDIARTAKALNPGVTIVFGGVGATFLWKHLLDHFVEIDFIVTGEGEYSFYHLVQHIENGHSNGDLEQIGGLAFRKKGGVFKTGAPEIISDLDQLPDPSEYFTYQHVASTRGCPRKCRFCGSPKFWGKKVRFHSSEYFVNQVENLHSRGVSFFYFSDDTFTVDKKRVIEICKKIIDRRLSITWAAISHVDYIDETILPWMRKAGCIQISYGVESGSEKIRKALGKHLRKSQIQKAFDLTKAYGILPRAYFIYGSPGETRHTVQATVDLMKQIQPLSAIFYILDIFPGTALHEEFKKRANVTDDIWLDRLEDIMYFQTDPEMTAEDVLSYGQMLRSSFYENLPDFVQDIRLVQEESFRPLHADFLSRIAMTFSHGDYAAIEAIKGKDAVAEDLYLKSLDHLKNLRAYLGLGMVNQRKREFTKSVRFIAQGLEHFPDSDQLNICQGINYMNLGAFKDALAHFLKFASSRDALFYIAECYRAMGDDANAAAYRKKYERQP